MERYLKITKERKPFQECGCYQLNNSDYSWLTKREAQRLVRAYNKLEGIAKQILERGLAEKMKVEVTFETKD